MRAQFTTERRVTMNYKKYLEDQLQTSIEAADHKSVYYALLHLTKELCKEKTANHGTKKDLLHFCRIFDWKTSFQQFDQSWNLR